MIKSLILLITLLKHKIKCSKVSKYLICAKNRKADDSEKVYIS